MNKLIKIALGISLLFAGQATFACDYPDRVLVPNGNTATKDEMVAGQRGVKAYVAAMEVYLECIVEEEKTARDSMGDLEADVEQEREDLLNKKYNAAVDGQGRRLAEVSIGLHKKARHMTGFFMRCWWQLEIGIRVLKRVDLSFQVETVLRDDSLKNFYPVFKHLDL
jgi:hypothetical protein